MSKNKLIFGAALILVTIYVVNQKGKGGVVDKIASLGA